MVLRERLYTIEEFWEYSRQPENDEKRLEWENGVIIDMGSSSRLNTVTAARIVYFLNAFVIAHNLGYVTGADGGFTLTSVERVRRPDAAFVSRAHKVKLTGVEFTIAPDLAVEVASPDEDVFKKVKEYIRSGTRMVWVVYADAQTVDVFTPSQEAELRVQELTIEDTLDGGDVLPGFSLPVRDVFPA